MLDLAPEVRSFVRHRAVRILHCTISTYGNNDCDVETIDCVLQNETPPRDGQPMKGVTYAIRSALYVAVTNRCCTTSLLESRGPGLSMPPGFYPLPGGDAAEPSTDTILDEIKHRLEGGANGRYDELVFAGVGEPLLRWPVVSEVVESLRSRHPDLLHLHDTPTTETSPTTDRPTKNAAKSMPIRLVTSGLRPGVTSVTPSTASHATACDGYAAKDLAMQISEAFDSVSVALNSADPVQYAELMRPTIEGLAAQDAHSAVCELVRECVAHGLPTECTVVAREGVDLAQAEELAARLGASCRVRPYFPASTNGVSAI